MVITDIYKPKKAFIVDSNVTHSAKSWPKYQTNQARVQGGNNNIRVSNPSYNSVRLPPPSTSFSKYTPYNKNRNRQNRDEIRFRGFLDAIFGGISGVFNKPTINKKSSITLQTNTVTNLSDVTKRLNQNITTRIIDKTSTTSSNSSQVAIVDLGPIVSLNSSVDVIIDISQEIIAVNTQDLTYDNIMESISSTVEDFTSQLSNIQTSAQQNYANSLTRQTEKDNFVASLIGSSIVGNVDAHQNIETIIKQISTNTSNTMRDTYIENIKKDTITNKIINTFVNTVKGHIDFSLAGVTASEAVVVNINLSQFTRSINNLTERINIGLQLLNNLSQSTDFDYSNSLQNELSSLNNTTTTTTTTDENTGDVIDTINPITGLGNVVSSISTLWIVAGAIVILVLAFLYFRSSSSSSSSASTSSDSSFTNGSQVEYNRDSGGDGEGNVFHSGLGYAYIPENFRLHM